MRTRALVLLLLACFGAECYGQAWDLLAATANLDRKKALLTDIIVQIEKNYKEFSNVTKAKRDTWFTSSNDFDEGRGTSSEKSINACGNGLPSGFNPVCDPFLGLTQACECSGKKKVDKVTVKPLDKLKDVNSVRNAANVAAFASGDSISAKYKRAEGLQDYENKLMYFGSVDGVLAMYPGVLWPYTKDEKATYGTEYTCGKNYDPRYRPWFLSASNGPKNVIFILDSSGSMTQSSRMTLLKKAASMMVDSLTMADYLGVVSFAAEAKTFLNLNFLAPAAKGFRNKVKDYIESLSPSGGTNYEAAFKQAFKMADVSYKQNYDSGCQTVYVFLTDGEQTLGSDGYAGLVQNRKFKASSGGSEDNSAAISRKEMFIIIGLGNDVAPSTPAGVALKNMACLSGGIFESVPDAISSDADSKFTTEGLILKAMGSFSRYFQTTNAIQKRDVVSYTEIYEGATFPMEMTTAAQSVYDKSDPDRWKFMGVVGIDLVTCGIEKAIFEKNPGINNPPAWPEETKFKGCMCADTYSYTTASGVVQKYDGVCTTSDWPNAWCATKNCGIKVEGNAISTGWWADCKPFGVRSELEDLLMKSGEECSQTQIDSCEIEALRPEAYRCGTSSIPALSATCNVTKQALNNWVQIPGFDNNMFTTDTTWAANPQDLAGYTDADNIVWSSDTSQCDQCVNTKMVPQCALPAKCGASGIPPIFSSMSDGAGAILSPCLSTCFLSAVALVLHMI